MNDAGHESNSSFSPSGSSLSVVVPSFNEEGNIRALYLELLDIMPPLLLDWEIILVDDGSTDSTWKEIRALHDIDNHVKGIRFSRNFGHQYALLAGISEANGDAVVMMDADLQHPPAMIIDLVREWQQGNKIVHTIRRDTQYLSAFKRYTSKLFYKLFSALSGVDLKSGMADFRLLDRQVVDQMLQLRENRLFLRGMVLWVGYEYATVYYEPAPRYAGTSKYTIRKMVRFASSGITAFSLIPLRLSVLIGIVTALIAFSELLYVLFVRLFMDTATPGWASAVGVLSFLFGVLFILIGVIGEYIGQILMEVKDRPRFLVSEQVGIEKQIADG